MSTTLHQQHVIKGTREFELVDDTIQYRVKSPFGEEELVVVLSVLDPEPVVVGSMLHFVSEVNREGLVKLFIDKPDPETFNAFVTTLRQRINEESFGRLAAGNRASAVSAEQVETTINMLETYLRAEDIAELLDALRELKANPTDASRLARVAETFNELGAMQGPVLTYAPFFNSLLSSVDLTELD